MINVRSVILRCYAAALPDTTARWNRDAIPDTYDLVVEELRQMMAENLLRMIQEDRGRTTVLAELNMEGLALARRCRDNPAGVC